MVLIKIRDWVPFILITTRLDLVILMFNGQISPVSISPNGILAIGVVPELRNISIFASAGATIIELLRTWIPGIFSPSGMLLQKGCRSSRSIGTEIFIVVGTGSLAMIGLIRRSFFFRIPGGLTSVTASFHHFHMICSLMAWYQVANRERLGIQHTDWRHNWQYHIIPLLSILMDTQKERARLSSPASLTAHWYIQMP